MKNQFLSLLLFLSFYGSIYAQSGTITGRVIDDEYQEDLIGATVVIAGTTTGSVTDMEGRYSIPNLKPGLYNLEVSYVGFESKLIPDVEVKNEEPTILDIVLGSGAQELEEVLVMATVVRSSEAGMLNVQKNSLQVMDGMGAEQFSRNGDSDLASAVKRITGVSVEGGKYVYVRGLGDRYSKTALNGADIPGLDPNRNTVQMDLFPSNLIENILVYKTFSPDLPGDFSGGYVNIETKDLPDAFSLQFSTSLGYNTNATLNSGFLTYGGGKTDWLGMDDGTRALPAIIRENTVPQLTGDKDLLYAMGDSFLKKEMDPSRQKAGFNNSHSLSFGNQHMLGNIPLGYTAGITYNRSYEYYGDGETNRQTLPGIGSTRLLTQLSLNDEMGKESVLWGVFANMSLQFSDRNKIKLGVMRNQSSDKVARSQQGFKPEDDPDLNFLTRGLGFTERSLNSAQLQGDHQISSMHNLKINWISSYTLSAQEEPDLRYFTFGYREFSGNRIYEIEPSIGQLPTRYFRDMNESHFDNKIHFTLPLNESGELKFGGSYVTKNREFRENQYRYGSNPNPPSFFNGNPNDYISVNLLSTDVTEGTYIVDAFELGNNYDAEQSVFGSYIMANQKFFDKLSVVGGLRLESTDLSIKSFDPTHGTGTLQEMSLLPSLNITYGISEESNFRVGYSRTLARPTFRELAPFASFDFIGDNLLVGNSNLISSSIQNLDLRWEKYMNHGEMVAVSMFYKNFTNPIEKTFNAAAPNQNELTWRNTSKGILYGMEAEVRKRLDFIATPLQSFTLGANLTYVFSRVDIDEEELMIIRASNPEAKDTRAMFGQSPYIINTF
ncbi:MAG: TonB-dependent receptor, partial [Cyclobacteriaceae bacterium]|nr:TonB-dependent receptor [Cyclobacteriaceae bacterium]